MKHFIAYHNHEKMEADEAEYDSGETKDAESRFSFLTKKKPDRFVGNVVWFITGEGKPRNYYLDAWFIVDRCSSIESERFFHLLLGDEGESFEEGIFLNDLPWFPAFLKVQSNFSLGVQEVKGEFLEGLRQATAAAGYPLPPEDMSDSDEASETTAGSVATTGNTAYPRAQAAGGFGDPESNKLVERAAVDFVVQHYRGTGWEVISKEKDRCGYDLHCRKDGREEFAEVKGVSGKVPTFQITAGEIRQFEIEPRSVLWVVLEARSAKPRSLRFTAEEFLTKFSRTALQFRAELRGG